MTDTRKLFLLCTGAWMLNFAILACGAGQQTEAIEIAAPTDFEAATFFVSDEAIIVEQQRPQEQCVAVKKSVLGCMEGITILPQDEVWLVNARECVCGETDLSRLKVSRLVGSDLELRALSDLTQAHNSGDERSTVFYIHGNQTDQEYAIARGLQVYRNAFAEKAHCRAPIRYVIWIWKSEKEQLRLYPDFLAKSQRAVRMGQTFAAMLNQFGDRNMLVFGYSLGVQVALSAFDSVILESCPEDPSRFQVALAAPAINAQYVARHALGAGCDSPVEQTVVFTNRRDRAIRAAQAIVRRRNPNDEPTIEGLSSAGKLNVGTVTSVDVFDETGRFHSVERYTRSGTLQRMMAELVNAVAARRSEALVVAPTEAVTEH